MELHNVRVLAEGELLVVEDLQSRERAHAAAMSTCHAPMHEQPPMPTDAPRAARICKTRPSHPCEGPTV